MVRSICIVLGVFLLTPVTQATDAVDELQEQVNQLSQQLRALQEQIRQERSDEFAQEETTLPKSHDETENTSFVDLSLQQKSSIEEAAGTNVLSNPWWRNFDLSGFGAVGYYDTGSAGTRGNGSFEIKEASLFVTAEVWDDVEFFMELQTNRLGKDDDKFTRTGEVYVHFHDVSITDSMAVGLKIGRIDIPFGEEYLWQDAIDNPLITNSAAYPYGWDEGILVYGDFHGLGWIAAITDGTDDRSTEENSDKAFNFKIYGSPLEALDLSLSMMTNGAVSKSAIEFGGSHFRPVGVAHQSTLGTSPSTEVDGDLIEINAKYSVPVVGKKTHLALTFGLAKADDSDPLFDRDFRWFSVEPFLEFGKNWYAALRYSEIGTYESTEGYHFDGKTFAGGNSAFGYDAERFRRISIGLGWTPNPHVRAKLEIGRDLYELIDVSPLVPNNGDRSFAGFEIAVGF